MEYLKTFESYTNGSFYISDIISLDEYNFSYKDSVRNCKNNLFNQIVESVVKKFKSNVSMFKDINIFWVDKKSGKGDGKGELSYYVRESFLEGPIVILFESGINNILDNYRLDSVNYKEKSFVLLEGLIHHSLSHAIYDVDSYYIFGMDRILNYSSEEDFVNKFVSGMDDGNVLGSVKKLCDLYCSKSWIGKDYSYNKSTNFY